MSDEAHRIMMNDYATNLNTILTAECPQGITIDQFKKKIVNGEITLSSTAQTSILTYAEPLKTYGVQFASTNNLTATNDSEKIFLSSFAPSTLIQNGKLLCADTLLRLTSFEMWTCALDTFYTEQCGINAVVSDKNDIKILTKSAITMLTQHVGDIGVLIMLNGFSNCLDDHNNKINVKENITYTNLISNTLIKQKFLEFGADIQNNSNNELYIPKFGFSIVTDSIFYLGREASHSYTFKIKRGKQTNSNLIENLVIGKFNNDKYQVFLIQYDLTTEDKIAISNKVPTYISSKTKIYRLGTESRTCWDVSGSSGVCTGEAHHTFLDILNGEECEHPESIKFVFLTLTQVDCGGGDGGGGGDGAGNDGIGGIGGSTGGTTNPGGPGGNFGGGGGSGDSSTTTNPGSGNTGSSNNGNMGTNDEVVPRFKPHFLTSVLFSETIPNKDCKTSKEDLKAMFPSLTDARATQLANVLNKYAKKFGINSKEKLQHFLAQASVESNNFTKTKEDTKYQVKTATNIFKDLFTANVKDINDFGSVIDSNGNAYIEDREAFFNFVYDDAVRDKADWSLNGNNQPGDGYLYLGRGIIQLTGKENYTQFTSWYQTNIDESLNFVDNPDLLNTDFEIGVIASLWFFKKFVTDKVDIDEQTTSLQVTKKVNPKGLEKEKRKNNFNKAKTTIKCN
jgi:putative chitinase